MDSLTPNVSPLRQRMIDDMRMRKMGGKTQIAYIRAVRRFNAFLKRSPATATADELRRFQLHTLARTFRQYRIWRLVGRDQFVPGRTWLRR